MKNNPWGQDEGIEKIEKGVKAVVKPVKKGAVDMFKDALQSLTGNYGQQVEQGQPPVQVQQVKQDEAKKLQETRARLVQINREIMEVRKKRENPPAAPEAQPGRARQKKMVEKQKKESVLAKLVKSRQGSKESMQRASG
ncbi:MAG: hypothetical protein AAB697_02300 [Patescibacteria group bacterium]